MYCFKGFQEKDLMRRNWNNWGLWNNSHSSSTVFKFRRIISYQYMTFKVKTFANRTIFFQLISQIDFHNFPPCCSVILLYLSYKRFRRWIYWLVDLWLSMNMYFLVGIVVFVILLGLKGANKVIACHNRKKCPPLSNIVIYIFFKFYS